VGVKTRFPDALAAGSFRDEGVRVPLTTALGV
jgi:hypothetical protein